MRNDSLYVLYTTKSEGEGSNFLREFKLNEFDGKESEVPQLYALKARTSFRAHFHANNRLYMSGERPEILDLATNEVLYSEFVARANPEWSEASFVFTYGGAVYRPVDIDDRSKGVDVVRDYQVVAHLPLDIDFYLPFTDHYFYGFGTARDVFTVYSLKTNTLLLELDLAPYRIGEWRLKKHVDRHGNRLFVLAGNSVLLIDLESSALVGQFNYVEQPAFQALLASEHLTGNAYAYQISAAHDGFVISNASSRSFMMYVTVSEAGDMQAAWVVHTRREITVTNTEGDLLLGMEDYRPKAWDKFTGQEIWQASAGTMASGIELGDHWVVYTHMAGDLQCFRWKKPYASPHRPG
ncbi:hypothetical protein HNP48_001615 [Acidovorax soli]|jgi:hypothetical protein|uniref:Uncharacterized protein n=1 Tax=Acidovorax soli TaxID=592050 RepID=A0A7X0PCD8_9BURK|nr:hypothetical protein [Acidovorax soli]MBB6558951.1 hypothetical protein [Acidovorax soli]